MGRHKSLRSGEHTVTVIVASGQVSQGGESKREMDCGRREENEREERVVRKAANKVILSAVSTTRHDQYPFAFDDKV